jgi:hypothetical protein
MRPSTGKVGALDRGRGGSALPMIPLLLVVIPLPKLLGQLAKALL